MYLSQLVCILFRQFLKSRFKVFLENCQFSITLWLIWDRKDVVNAKLLENLVHQLVLEFCAIVWHYEVRSHVNRQVIIDKTWTMVSDFLSGMGKASGHPTYWSMIVSMCWFPDADMLRSETRSMAILSKVLSGIFVICSRYTCVLAFPSYTMHNYWCICKYPYLCLCSNIDIWWYGKFSLLPVS